MHHVRVIETLQYLVIYEHLLVSGNAHSFLSQFMIRRGTEAVDSIQSIVELYHIRLLLPEQQLVQSPEY